MGSTSSKFKKYLQHGDEFAAMQIYQSSPELRKNLDPNLSYGENHNHNTALHYAAKHGMKHLLRTFLNDLGGNPNKKNGLNETVLHCACQLNQTKSFSAQERRAACVQLLLYWKGVPLKEGGREKVDLSAQDKEGNTTLHWAAFNGLKKCVELLLAHGAPLFIENNDKMTPCDLAMKASHHDVARLLESRMVFADNSDVINEDELMVGQEEVYSGLRSQDLQEAKDQLLVDTSDMLKIPLFTAEALLRNNEWSRELLLEKWMKDPMECCRDAGVQAPSTILHQGNPWDSSNCTSPTFSEDSNKSERMCEICVSPISEKDKTIAMSCKHNFCRSCWGSYLTIKIQSGDAHHIMCPAYQCHILVPVETIEKLVSPEMARRYLQFDIKAFVESNKSIKWCPVAGCGRAVRLPETEQNRTKTGNKSIPITSHAVDCGNSHFFCWECLGEAHAPCGCNQWQEWQKKIAEIKPEELKASCNESEDAANCLWLVTNSKPCPNCKSPIQKNEGCNHMKCSKCKFDFCWVCQESWKKHSSATGGYFRCNRFEAVTKADEKQGTLISEALDRNNQMQEISRFLHYYTRFRNHENSQKMEEPLLTTANQKMEILANSLGLKFNQDNGVKGTRFFEDGVRELLKARRVLCGSYVYGYYLQDDGCNKSIFEFMQNELEEVAEKLSEMIARPYLRTPKSVIIQTTALARRKRHEFVRAVAQGLVPPETPPSQRKVKKAKYHNIDYSPGTPWKKNCNWTSFGSEEDLQNLETSIQEIDLQAPDHQCGLRCNRYNCSKIGSDYNVELVIALEMSRLQMIEDRLKQANTAVTPDPSSSISNNSSESNDDQLKLAIQLSLQDSSGSFSNLSEEETSKSGRRYFSKSNADITVDYFLKTLANHQIDLKNLEVDFNMLRNDAEKMKNEREFLFKPCNSGNEDGRFQISDIHENGFTFADDDEDFDDNDIRLKRSHSTGDLCIRRSGRRTRTRVPGDESRYHLDSDHSSQHDERPEEIVRKTLTLPSSSLRQNQHLLPHQEERLYEGQSSVDDTTSDSMNADMEVCEIMENVTDEDLDKSIDEDVSSCVEKEHQQAKKTERISQISDIRFHNPFASLKAKLCSAHLPKTYCLTKLAVNKSIGLLQETDNTTKSKSKTKSEKLASAKHAHVTISKSDTNPSTSTKNNPETAANYKTKFSKSTSFLHETHNGCGKKISLSNLKLKMPKPEKRSLETDSSNEYESETGIPRSPTLFISGVSISRTPEPKSPRLSMVSTIQQSRSSSISAPLSSNTLNTSNNSLNNFNTDTSNSFRDVSHNATPPTSQHCSPKTNAKHSGTANKENTKSKSASEPEREREVFKFPKSSTDGALSSVLHVQESNLSSDDFHEALFLFERSPKTRDSRRKKRSKKKDKEERREEASSAL
ncbi:ankyrin repeat and IBR domain-containing protein 1-like isoform X3 [Agrilus planipennis]|uniref:RBR-type E3 ubiquitin transferase n=1 Tax=Agrilus planipennis TaxID=224129 RepID=A0A7F5R6M6_AGRPL|nr:ankyrin repeat and IBR domain-containing protein 1-like isoform X2 [Agrilus planipennis]XP_025831612.1 ankyrin repeat and IBR domain-containing protein 1-like isoform X3 [Agrilus planipennis]